ncbi:MAG: hypothetical protein AAF497_02230, partial [Planctomycetota bacterium]
PKRRVMAFGQDSWLGHPAHPAAVLHQHHQTGVTKNFTLPVASLRATFGRVEPPARGGLLVL